MALIVEDGSVVTGAESYASVAEADAYFAAQGITSWAGTTLTKEIALRKATAYLDLKYGPRFAGFRKSDLQALRWPRVEAPKSDLQDASLVYYDQDSIPTELKQATFEAAIRTMTSDLMPDLERGGAVTSISIPGVISKSFAEGAAKGTTYPIIDTLIRDLTRAKGTVELARS